MLRLCLVGFSWGFVEYVEALFSPLALYNVSLSRLCLVRFSWGVADSVGSLSSILLCLLPNVYPPPIHTTPPPLPPPRDPLRTAPGPTAAAAVALTVRAPPRPGPSAGHVQRHRPQSQKTRP